MNTEPGDDWLVHATLTGQTTAFETLVRRYRRAALARALGVLGDPAEAEDVVQEAFVRAYRHLALCRHPERVGSWLLTIVHRGALNAVRARRRRRAVPVDETIPAGAASSPDHRLDREEDRTRLLWALAELPPVQRAVVLLADLEQYSHARIAETLGLSVLMSRRHLSDARRTLRALLGSEGG